MLIEIIDKIHDCFISQMLIWCNSCQILVIAICICVSILMYLAILFLLKVTESYNEEHNINMVYKLYNAIDENDVVGCISVLQKYPQCINKFSSDGYTPFQMACANGNTQLVKLMLKKGADVNMKSEKDESPFYLATFYYIKYPQFKNATCIRELYYAGANIDAPNGKGLTALQMAATFGHTPLVKWLLAKKASTRVVPDPYLIACSQGHQDTANVIWKMSKGFSIEYK